MALCVMGALHGTASANHLAAETCGHCGVVSTPDSDRHGDEDGCPPDHHHHPGCCSQPIPLTAENNDFLCLVGNLGSCCFAARPEGDLLPEEPFLGSEKPPLI